MILNIFTTTLHIQLDPLQVILAKILRYSFITCGAVCLPLKYTAPYCGFHLRPIFSYILRIKHTICICKEALSSQTMSIFAQGYIL